MDQPEEGHDTHRLRQQAWLLEEAATTRPSGSLCSRCKSGMIIRQASSLTTTTYCMQMSQTVPNDIIECSRFRDAKHMDLDLAVAIHIPIDKRIGVDDRSYR